MILVTTIWHTGTHSLLETFEDHARRKQAGEIIQCHCNGYAIRHADFADEIVMTYRNPLRTAASWINRGRLPKAGFQIDRTWREHWRIWAELIPRARVVSVNDLGHRLNTHGDTKGMHALIDADDLGRFYEIVPRDVIYFAFEKCAEVEEYLPAELETN